MGLHLQLTGNLGWTQVQHATSVVARDREALEDVVHRAVRALRRLRPRRVDGGAEPPHQLVDARDVELAVVQLSLWRGAGSGA